MEKLFDRFPYLESSRIILRQMTDEDADALFRMVQNENVYRYLPTFLIEKQCEDMLEVIRRSRTEQFLTKEALLMGVYLKQADGEPLCGIAELYHYDSDLGKVTLGYRLAEEYWGKGIATEIIKVLMNYVFADTDVKTVVASHITANPASGKVLMKNGFKKTASSVEQDWGFERNACVDIWQLTKTEYLHGKDED